MTQAGQDFLPRVPKQTNGPCALPSRFRKRLFCAFGQSQSKAEKSQNLEEEEGKKEGGGRERSGMWRGGGGNKIRLCTKGGKSTICIALFFPP